MDSAISIFDCWCGRIIIAPISNKILKAIWITIWLLLRINSMYSIHNHFLSTISEFIQYFTLTTITFYLFIITTTIIIAGIFSKKIFNFLNFNKNDILLLTILQIACIFYQLLYPDLSSYTQVFYHTINLLPIICAFLNVIIKIIHLNYFNLILQIWLFEKFYFYGEFILSLFFFIVWWLIIIPIENLIYACRLNDLWNWMIFIILESIPDIESIRDPLGDFIINCALCALFVLMIGFFFGITDSTRFTNRNKNNPELFQWSHLFSQLLEIEGFIFFTILFDILAIVVCWKIFNKTIPPLLSLLFTVANTYNLVIFLCYFREYEIHKCDDIKFRCFNFASLILTFYILKFIFNV